MTAYSAAFSSNPATSTHVALLPEDQQAIGITDGLLARDPHPHVRRAAGFFAWSQTEPGHGSMPDAMILVHQPTRLCTMNDEIEIMPLPDWVELHERMAGYLKPAPVVGVAINGYDLDEAAAREWAERITAETGLPAVDPVKFGAEPLIEAVVDADVAKPRPAARTGAGESAGARK